MSTNKTQNKTPNIMKMDELDENSIVQLLNVISTMHGSTLAEKILDYCETYDKDIRFVGEYLAESENFKHLFHIDCVNGNMIKDELYKIHLKEMENIDEW